MAKKPTITTISSGFGSTTTLNNNFTALRDAFDNFVSRDGETPNTMTADLDMNSNNILNAAGLYVDGTDIFSIVNKVTVSTSSPLGGSDQDIWFKVSA